MSLRFGRNQRRRMREEIARQESQAARLTRELEGTASNLRDALNELDEAKQLAGRMSIFFPPETYEVASLRSGRETWEVAAPSRLSFESMQETAAAKSHVFRTMRLPFLISRIDQGALDQAVHVRVNFADDEVCYSASNLALAVMPTRELSRRIAQELGEVLARKMDARRRW